ncbi:MAG: hypothetical protein ABI769_19750 [Pseudomonadota bacterium]
MSSWTRLLWLSATVSAAPVLADDPDDDTPTRTLGTVTVNAIRPSSLPTQIPTTIESITGADVASAINATDSEDALKYAGAPRTAQSPTPAVR